MGLSSFIFSARLKLPFFDYSEAAVKALIDVLQQVDCYPCLYFNQTVLQEAIRRYETVWLPLLALTPEEKSIFLVPPIDVEWVWFCHMLCPQKYISDCTAVWSSLAGKEHTAKLTKEYIFNHALLPPRIRAQGLQQAETLWKKHFPHEPFDISSSLDNAPIHDDTPDKLSPSSSRIQYDIAKAASRQMAFHYQVCIMPHYRHDDRFIRTARQRYQRFLNLKSKYKTDVLVPTYDIDIFWHAHILHPRTYARDTRRILNGKVFPHDDTLNDRSSGSELEQQWNFTQTAWSNHYSTGTRLICNGTLWRGNIEMQERMWRSDIQKYVTNVQGELNVVPGDLNCIIQLGKETHLFDKFNTEVWSQVPWIHTADLRQYIETERESDLNDKLGNSSQFSSLVMPSTNFTERDFPFIRRLSCLTLKLNDNYGSQTPRNALLLGCVTSFVPKHCCKSHMPRLKTVIDVFHPSCPVPLASAHQPRPYTVYPLSERFSVNTALNGYKKYYVLRVGGLDAGILEGSWVGFELRNMVGEGRRYSGNVPATGYLQLKYFNLSPQIKRPTWVKLRSTFTDSSRPRAYEIENHSFGRIEFDLASGEVHTNQNLLLAYVMCLAAASLLVELQPRFKPMKEEDTMYPDGNIQPASYPVLQAAGAERIDTDAEAECRRRTGAAELLRRHSEQSAQYIYVDTIEKMGSVDKPPTC